MDFFSSDLHLDHKNILEYANRPFSSIEEHDSVIIENINKKVGKQDRLFILGDFTFTKHKKYRAMITCPQVILIYGNHDNISKREALSVFQGAHDLYELKTQNSKGELRRIILCHYAMKVWHHSYRGTWHLWGHSHGALPDDPESLSFDIGVDCHNFQPLSVDEVEEIMKKKSWTNPFVQWEKEGKIWTDNGRPKTIFNDIWSIK